jgi:hypothetical protein
MTLKQIADDWFDKTIPWPVPDPNKLQGQCVQFIRWLLHNFWMLPQWLPIAGAADFWSNYERDISLNCYWEKIPNTPEFVPQEGDVVIWNKNKGGGYGHIAVVIGDNNCTRFFFSVESNWKPLKVTTVQHNYNDVLGFFRRRKP